MSGPDEIPVNVGDFCRYIQDDMFVTDPLYMVIAVESDRVILEVQGGPKDGQQIAPTRAMFDRWWAIL